MFVTDAPFDFATASGEPVLALGGEIQQALFPAIVARVRQEAPGVDLRVRPLTMDSVDEGRRDLVQLAIAPDLSSILGVEKRPDLGDLVHKTLYARKFVVVGAHAAWPTAPDLPRYIAADHVILSDSGGARGFMDDLLGHLGHSRRVACSTTSFAAVAQIVRSSRLLALLPSEVVGAFGPGLVAYPPLLVPSMAMRMLWHPRHTTQARRRFWRSLIAEVARAHVA